MSTENSTSKGYPVLTGMAIGALLVALYMRKTMKTLQGCITKNASNPLVKNGLTPVKAVSKIKVVSPAVLPNFGDRLIAGKNDLVIFTAQQSPTGEYFNTNTRPFFGGRFDHGDFVGTYAGSTETGEYLIDRHGVKYYASKEFLKVVEI